MVDTTGISGGPLPSMQWDPALATLAANWVSQCMDTDSNGLVNHSSQQYRTNAAGYAYVGENIYASGGTATAQRRRGSVGGREGELHVPDDVQRRLRPLHADRVARLAPCRLRAPHLRRPAVSVDDHLQLRPGRQLQQPGALLTVPMYVRRSHVDHRPAMTKTFLITGANTGIGKVAAIELAKRGNHVILACRSREEAQPVLDAIGDKAEFVELDLGDLASVRRCAEALEGPEDRRAHQQRGPRRPSRHDEGRLRDPVRHEPPRPLSVHAPVDRSGRRARRQRRERVALRREGHRLGRRARDHTLAHRVSRVRGLASSRTCCSRRSSRSACRGVTTYAVHPGAVGDRCLAARAGPDAGGS